jgi:putative ABC transport system ATP-binding protein
MTPPSGGRVRLAGRDVTGASRRERTVLRRHTVSFVFQSFNLFPGLTAVENVQFGADVAGRTDPDRVAAEVLAAVGLKARLDRFPHQLSGGEQQWAGTRHPEPDPAGRRTHRELDFRTGVRILELLRGQADAGKTVLVVTHNREISRAADPALEFSSGRIVHDGAPRAGRAPIGEVQW